MIAVAAELGVDAWRDARGRGVWSARGKLGAVGVRVRDGVTTHGFALNVALDLDAFAAFTPCGMPGLRVTSLANEGAPMATVAAAARGAERACRRAFDAATDENGMLEVAF
jgi:lipoate-protein ligase B